MTQPASKQGCLYVLDTHVLVLGMPVQNLPHAHYSASVLIAAGQPFQFNHAGRWLETRGVLVRPCLEQQLHTRDDKVMILHLDPDSVQYARLDGRVGSRPYVELERGEIDAVRRLLPRRPRIGLDAAASLLEETVAVLAQRAGEVRPRDPRLGTVCRLLEEQLDAPPSIAQLAETVALSESRLQHLFKAQLGLSISQYLLWLRTRRTVRALQRGNSLTEAAGYGGFADSAHFSRTFRRMFGLPPSRVLKNSSRVQVIMPGRGE